MANVGSIVGLFTTPFAAAHCSSFGAHARDALRLQAEDFVKPVVEALLTSPPPRVIRAGTLSVRLPLLERLLPGAMFDAKLSKAFGLGALR